MLEKFRKYEFKEIYKIMEYSFPHDEIRSFKGQEKLLEHQNYSILVLRENDEILGFVAVWDFEKFVFLEHFAVTEKHRNKGIGNKILSELGQFANKKIILEVEHPSDDISIRRIDFYKRNDYILFDFNYIMPAYDENHKDVPLCIMSNDCLNQTDFNDFYDKIKNVVNKKTL